MRAGVLGCGHVCAVVHRCAHVCVSVHTCTWVCGVCRMRRCAWVCVEVCGSVRVSASVCVG